MLDIFDSLGRRDGRNYDKCIVQIFILLPHVSISWDQYHEIEKRETFYCSFWNDADDTEMLQI